MNLDRRTFLAGLAPITIAGAAGSAGPLEVACANGFKPAMARIAIALEAPLPGSSDISTARLRRRRSRLPA
jgi:hypothetical protein